MIAGRYRRLSTIGIGGMARVHLAEDERLGRQVAVKQLHAAGPEDAALRFEREAKLGASLNHPNLVSIYDIAFDEDSVLIVMEYVDGQTLQGLIERGGLAPERVAEIVRDVAAGLDHAHSHGVVHRDVKPANILVRRDGVAKLADLGIATAAERTSITRSDIVLGTAAYMAPEQLAGERAGPPADIYALAAVAYEALSGAKARAGKTPIEVAHEVVTGGPPDLRAAWPDAPRDAVTTLARAMDRDPERRQRSAGVLADELERALRSGAADASPTEATLPVPAAARRHEAPRRSATAARAGPGRAARTTRSRRWLPVLAVVTLLVLAAGAGIAALGGEDGDGGHGGAAATDSAKRQQTGSGGDRPGSGSRAAPGGDASEQPAEPTPEVPADPAPEESAGAEPASDPVALNDQGYRLMQAGDYDGAIPLLEQAVAAYPADSQNLTYAYALFNLGRSLRLAGRAEEAVPILERRLRIPNQTETVQQELDAARGSGG